MSHDYATLVGASVPSNSPGSCTITPARTVHPSQTTSGTPLGLFGRYAQGTWLMPGWLWAVAWDKGAYQH